MSMKTSDYKKNRYLLSLQSVIHITIVIENIYQVPFYIYGYFFS